MVNQSSMPAVPTFEDVDRHVNAVTLPTLPQPCVAYKAVRPILLILAAVPLVPKTWQAVISAFIAAMDGMCP